MDENEQPIQGHQTSSVSCRRLRVNHYITKSQAEREQKFLRRLADTSERSRRPERARERDKTLNDERDEALVSYAPAIFMCIICFDYHYVLLGGLFLRCVLSTAPLQLLLLPTRLLLSLLLSPALLVRWLLSSTSVGLAWLGWARVAAALVGRTVFDIVVRRGEVPHKRLFDRSILQWGRNWMVLPS